ncbi:hypothetical protein HK097_000010 [Rhizophlyctis rosea]|uniref:Translocon-associated protein subunit alpha n=1 Tax=Rhizophlyctis rosea TaxID=64517 RepID=A0AAD5XAI2_9FUNG|nr:hypothetical protein HK097_000010 [Rhizophlyctis rosea]
MVWISRSLIWLCLAIFSCAQAQTAGKQQPLTTQGLTFNATLPNNPFNLVTLDEPTEIRIHVKNTGNSIRTIFGVSGVLTHPQDPKVITQNITSQRYSKEVRPGKEITLTYKAKLHREGEAGLTVFVDFYDKDEKAESGTRAVAYQGTVTISHNDSWFDLQSISIYLILTGLVGWAGYLGYQSFFGGPAKVGRPKRRPVEVAAPARQVNPGEPDMDWIPDHLRKAEEVRKSPKLKKRGTK